MSDPISVLDRGYQMMWREGRADDAVRGLGEDFEWVVPGHPEGDLRLGPESVFEFFREWTEPWEGLVVDWELEQGAPERVLAIIHMHGRGRASGVPAEMHFSQVWTFRDGRAVRMELYWDNGEARRAAGLA
jgi:ketosteroid isomerase-like protein